MTEFLLELFSEEIPARFQKNAALLLRQLAEKKFSETGLAYSELSTYVTPRRLTLVVKDLPLEKPDLYEERRGPRSNAPAQALDGFLNSLHLKKEDCSVKETEKGAFWFASLFIKGEKTSAYLGKFIQEIIEEFKWPKSMRWQSTSLSWARPLHNILALFNGEVVSAEVKFGPNLTFKTNSKTYGHRFLSPSPFEVKGFEDYVQKLEKAFVILDSTKRQEVILKQVQDLAKQDELKIKEDLTLLEEVAGLVEMPYPFLGRIDPRFMKLPAELLVVTSRHHQRYFNLETKEGTLAPSFITISNVPGKGNGLIVEGNERVLSARLNDAAFFFEQDQKTSLLKWRDHLKKRIYYAGLGSLFEKTERLAHLASSVIGSRLIKDKEIKDTSSFKEKASLSGALSKADLATSMVGEFPELQGIMGFYYAKRENLPPDVSLALKDHYAPLGPTDKCPTEPLSFSLALADKIDALTGFFALNLKPSGTKDPFALRRAALGMIRLINESHLKHFNLREIFQEAYDVYQISFKNTKEETVSLLLEFMAERLKHYLKEAGYLHDQVMAALSSEWSGNILKTIECLKALRDFLKAPESQNLLIAYRRARNIVHIEEKKEKQVYQGTVSKELLKEEAEKALFNALSKTTQELKPLLEEALPSYPKIMAKLADLKAPLDTFFEKITVNTEDQVLRQNRLELLALIRQTFEQVADFSALEV